MIICFSGTPGSGKSYEAVKKILDNLKLGRVVYTNIDGFDDPECLEAIKTLVNFSDYELGTHLFFLQGHEVNHFWQDCKPGSLIVIDEVHKWFNNRDWQKAENREFGNWASTHRHHGYDVVLLTQDIGKIDSHVRSLVEWTYSFRKINFLGSKVQKKYICYSFMGDETSGRPLGKNFRTYIKEIFHCYRSYVAKDVKELGIMTHFNILKHPVFYVLPVLLCFLLYLVFYKSSLGSGDLFGMNAAEKQRAARFQSQSKSVVSDNRTVDMGNLSKTVVYKSGDAPVVKPEIKEQPQKPVIVGRVPKKTIEPVVATPPTVVASNVSQPAAFVPPGVSSLPERKLIGVVNGKNIYR